jgi:hypothetical protein
MREEAMIDPQLKYCPKCRDEYMPHAVRCAACEIALITGEELQDMERQRHERVSQRAGEITAEDDIVTIHSAQLAEIKKLEDLLREERIAVLIAGDDKSCGKGCCPSTFYLNVRREDALDASRIIEKEFERTTGIHGHDRTIAGAVFNPNAMQVQCPACGFVFTPSSSECPECGLCF